MPLTRVYSGALHGVDAVAVEIEVNSSQSLHLDFAHIVSLGDVPRGKDWSFGHIFLFVTQR